MPTKKWDWLKIKEEFVNSPGKLELGDIATKYGISYHTLANKAAKEKWTYLHERFQARVFEQKTELKALAVATEGTKWDDTCMAKAHALMDLIDIEFTGQITLDNKGNQVHIQRPAKDIALALKIAQEVGKVALGDKQDPLVTIEGQLSVEEVAKKYADAGSSGVPTTNSSQ